MSASHRWFIVLRRSVVASWALLLAGGSASAQTVFTSNTAIGDGDLTYDGQDITVRGCTVTINGAHAFNSLTIERNTSNSPGVVTHSAGFTNGSVNGMWLAIAGDLTVQGSDGGVASRMDVNGKGYPAGQGPGTGTVSSGGGYGGRGATGDGGNGGGTYGSLDQPVDLGSGSGTWGGGNPGGGAIRLTVGGRLRVDGAISAEGLGDGAAFLAGGSGGSIWITVATLTGTGSVRAHGGSGRAANGYGGGGGGRLAIAYTSSTFSGTVTAYGGTGYRNASPGTIAFFPMGNALPQLVLDNGSNTPSMSNVITQPTAFSGILVSGRVNAVFPGAISVAGDVTAAGANVVLELNSASLVDGDVQVMDGANLTHSAAVGGFYLNVAGDVAIDASSALNADGRGYPAGQGLGAGTQSSGGGYGGPGATGDRGSGGDMYGPIGQPVELGSGSGTWGPGNPGGGAIRLAVGGTLTVLGTISADGLGDGVDNRAGGSGGSLWLTTGTLAGSGSITADGGRGRSVDGYGGGGGGRVHLAYASSTFSGAVTAYGGTGYLNAAPGTIVVFANGDELPQLWLDNGSNTPSRTTVITGNSFRNLLVTGRALPVFPVPFAVAADVTIEGAGTVVEINADATVGGSVWVSSGANLTHSAGTRGHHLNVAGSMTIDSASAVNADGRGFPAGQGPGAGTNTSGGGYGGRGGKGDGGDGGGTYGSAESPVDLGSGSGTWGGGNPGGGAIRLTVGGWLIVDGAISADGLGDGVASLAGGSGGSIWLTAGTLTGTGSITADGGRGRSASGYAGGGGGRIAVYACENDFPSQNMTVAGGTGYRAGEAGTIFTRDLEPPQILAQPQDWEGLEGETATLSVTGGGDGELSYQWRKDGQAIADGPTGSGSTVSGATTPTLTVVNVQAADVGDYDCVVSDDCGLVTSDSATLGVESVDCLAWELVTATGPSGRSGHGLAYDSARGVVVMFGGFDGADYLGDTWEFDGVSWALRSTTGPSARRGHAMAFDSARGVTVFYGGWSNANGETYYDDTWEWDGASWTQVATTNPPARAAHAMAYDSLRGVTIVFGGQRGPGGEVLLGDTWEWDGSAWTQMADSGPSPRTAITMSYDAPRGVAVLFGGDIGSLDSDDETWEWDGVEWVLRANSGPPPRWGHTLTYDPMRGVTVLFGGDDLSGLYSDTWEWNGADWRQRAVTGPPGRRGHASDYDSAGHRVVVFGGWDDLASFYYADLWSLGGQRPVEITDQPDDWSGWVGDTVSVSVTATGQGDFGYQWRRDGQALTDGPTGNGSTVSGATTQALTIVNAQAADSGGYDCVVTDACGPTTSDAATIEVGAFDPRLFIVLNPEPQCVCVGDELTVEVRMGDLGPNFADGFQAFLSFDTAKLQYLTGDYTDDPFGFHIVEPIRVSGGTIDMAASVNPPDGQTATNADALLATMTFRVLASDGPTTIGFRAHDPPSRLAFEGEDIGALLVDTPVFVVDLTPPVVTPPADITTDSDAGGCTAVLAVGQATAADACTADPIIVGERSDALPLTDPYPGGATTIITWSATDACGNVGTATQRVTVSDRNLVEVAAVQLEAVNEPSLTRCITFELVNCDGATFEVSEDVPFTGGGSGPVTLSVPCGMYDCIAARDKKHTLKRYDADDFAIAGHAYAASFIDASGGGGDDDALQGGNLNDDRYIDILDFSVFVSKWNTNYGAGDSRCSLSGRHADISGNGLVATEDFTYLYVGYLKEHEDTCCGAGPGGDDDGPVVDIGIEELIAMGEAELIVADLNGDGRVNVEDVAAFLNGERPRKKPKGGEAPEDPTRPRRLIPLSNP